nr:MAG TPA: hypothetical protein [Crassvirales sp.]
MANEESSQSIGFGYVAPRPIIKKHLDIFANSLNKIDEKHKEALKQRSAIQTALAQIELDSSEDDWKAAYARSIQDQIDDAAKGGDYSSALSLATTLAGDAISAPELTSRIRTNNQRQEVLKTVKARQDLNDDTKLRFEEQNGYEYKPIYDDDGRVVGSNDWKAKWTPVKDVNVEDLVKYTIGVAQADSKQSSRSVTTGSDFTKRDGSASGYDKQSGSSSGKTVLSLAKLKTAATGTYNQNAEAIQQDYENKIWKIDKLTKQRDALPPDQQDELNREIQALEHQVSDANGIRLGSGKAMFFYQIDPSLRAASYTKISNETTSLNKTSGREAPDKDNGTGGRTGVNGGLNGGGVYLGAGVTKDGPVVTTQNNTWYTPMQYPVSSGSQINTQLNGKQ